MSSIFPALKHTLICVLILMMSQMSKAQKMKYTKFEGVAYKLPSTKKHPIYNEDYKNLYKEIAQISWDSIHVSHRDEEEGFPDVPKCWAFGIMFTSQLTISESSMYRFALTSDDGTLLWINDKLIISNDYSKGWHMKADTLALNPATYDIKIWYSQTFPTMFGVKFESEDVEGELVFDIDTFALDQDLLFASNSYQISDKGKSRLDTFALRLYRYSAAKVSIAGHTDDIGSEAYNLTLSTNRAQAIRDYLIGKHQLPMVKYHSIGYGQSRPLQSNETDEGRSANRRVEITVEGI